MHKLKRLRTHERRLHEFGLHRYMNWLNLNQCKYNQSDIIYWKFAYAWTIADCLLEEA